MMDTQAAAIEPSTVPPQAIILQMAMGPLVSQALGVAARLGIPDLLAAGEKHVDDIAAAATGKHAQTDCVLQTSNRNRGAEIVFSEHHVARSDERIDRSDRTDRTDVITANTKLIAKKEALENRNSINKRQRA